MHHDAPSCWCMCNPRTVQRGQGVYRIHLLLTRLTRGPEPSSNVSQSMPPSLWHIVLCVVASDSQSSLLLRLLESPVSQTHCWLNWRVYNPLDCSPFEDHLMRPELVSGVLSAGGPRAPPQVKSMWTIMGSHIFGGGG